MNSDPASLSRLRDVVEPVAVSWWPPAAGWWVLLGAVLIAAAVYLIHAIRRWRANEYRRIATKEVQAAVDGAAISRVLKRTALVAFPRAEIAAMSGTTWCQWLSETSGLTVTQQILNSLTIEVFRDQQPEGESELRRFALAWIKRHRRPLEHHEAAA